VKGSPKLWKNRYHNFGWQVVSLNLMVHSSSLYMPTLLPYAGSTLNSFGRLSNIVPPRLIVLSFVFERHPYYRGRSVAICEGPFQSMLSYGLSSTLSFLQKVFRLLLVREQHLSYNFMLNYHALVFFSISIPLLSFTRTEHLDSCSVHL